MSRNTHICWPHPLRELAELATAVRAINQIANDTPMAPVGTATAHTPLIQSNTNRVGSLSAVYIKDG